MDVDHIIRLVGETPVIGIDRETVDALLTKAEAVREDSTSIAGRIRTLRLRDLVLVQERNPEGDHFVRVVESEEAAHRFVNARLAAYERMWDG